MEKIKPPIQVHANKKLEFIEKEGWLTTSIIEQFKKKINQSPIEAELINRLLLATIEVRKILDFLLSGKHLENEIVEKFREQTKSNPDTAIQILFRLKRNIQ